MKFKYYELPFGAQLLVWTTRMIINGSCRTNPNKYELVEIAYNKVGLYNGMLLLKELLSILKYKSLFNVQCICSKILVSNEINLINCIEYNKSKKYKNEYFIKLWNLEDNKIAFTNVVKKIADEFENNNLNTDINRFPYAGELYKQKIIINKTLH